MVHLKDPSLPGRRKTNFEIVQKSEVAPLRDALLQPHILSVSYNHSLARTREMLFTAAGLRVSTFTDMAKAIQACEREIFDLAVIGHSVPLEDKKKLLRALRRVCTAPILALVRHGDPLLADADYFFDPYENPAHLLQTVLNILRERKIED